MSRVLSILFLLSLCISDTYAQNTDSLIHSVLTDESPWVIARVNNALRDALPPAVAEEAVHDFVREVESESDSIDLYKARFLLAHLMMDKDSGLQLMQEVAMVAHVMPLTWEFYIRQDLGYLLQDRGMFDQAMDLSRKNLELSLSAQDSGHIAIAYHDLGYNMDRMMNYHEAIRHYEKARPYINEKTDTLLLARNFGLMGIAYDELREFDKAIANNKRAIELFQSTPRGLHQSATWNSNLGNTYVKTGQYELAEKALLEARDINLKVDRKYGLAIVNINLGRLYLEMKQLDKAKEHLDLGMHYSKRGRLVRFQAEGHFHLSKFFTLTGEADSSARHLEDYLILNDSIIIADKAQQIADLQVKYETEKQIQANQILENENDILELQRDRQQYLFYGSLCLTLMLLIAGLLGYRAYRSKQENRLNQELIAEREKGLKAMIQSIEEERQRIAKDLHDGVGQQMTALKLQYNTLRNKLRGTYEEELEEIASLLDDTGKDIRSVSHQMMPRALTELGLIPALKDMLSKSFDGSTTSYSFEVLGTEREVDKQVEVGLYRIAQELVNNVIKHADADHVDFQIVFRPKFLIMSVEDNGIGLGNDAKEGHGLLNIMSRLNAISGEARYEDGQEHGTIAVIRIPLA